MRPRSQALTYDSCLPKYLERFKKAGNSRLLDSPYHQLIAVNNQTMEALRCWLEIQDKKME